MKNKVYILVLLTYSASSTLSTVQHQHRRYQYNSPADERGTYNFAYDTGSKDAHSMRMEYRDDNGIVRGRYGYTDPNGKLRMVEYEAGPGGYVARGDVGPDGHPHDETPKSSRLRLAGWDPDAHPISTVNSKKFEATIDHPVKGYYPPRPAAVIVMDPHPDSVAIVQPTIDHPVKGYAHPPKPVAVVVTKDHHHPVKKVYPQPPPVAILEPVVDHRTKGYREARPAAVVVAKDHYVHPPPQQVVVERTIAHPVKGHPEPPRAAEVVVAKDHYVHPPPQQVVVERTIAHPVKGHPEPPRAAAVVVAKDHYVHPPPRQVVVERTIAHPVKGHPEPPRAATVVVAKDHYVYPPPRQVVMERTIAHPVKGHIEQQRPIVVLEPIVDHRTKGRPVSIVEKHHHPVKVPYPKPVTIVERTIAHPVKGYDHTKPAAVVVSEDHHHHPKLHPPPRPVAIVEPIEHPVKGYAQRPVERFVRVEPHHHHQDKRIHQAIVAPIIQRTDSHHHHIDKSYKQPIAVVQKSQLKADHGYHAVERVVQKFPVVVSKVGNQHHTDKGYQVEDHSGHHHHSRDEHRHYQSTVVKDGKLVARRYHPHNVYHAYAIHPDAELLHSPVKYTKINNHIHPERMTVHNIDVHPDSIRKAEHRGSDHTDHNQHQHITRTVVTNDYPVASGDVIVREHSSPVRTSRSHSVSSSYLDQHGTPRSIRYRPGNRHSPTSFVWE